MFEKKKDSNLVSFQFGLENIFVIFMGEKAFPTLGVAKEVFSCLS